MANEKLSVHDALVEATATSSEVNLSSMEDTVVMSQMGIRQQLERRFNAISILGLSLTLLASWEAIGG